MNAMPKELDLMARPDVGVESALSGPKPPECGSHSARRWYCVQTDRGRESEVRDRLEDQRFGAFLPVVIGMRTVRPGIRQAAVCPAFPTYLFAAFDVKADRWRSILYTRGVRGIFSSAPETPTPVPQRQIETLLALGYDRPIADDPRPPLIQAGARLRLIEGPFADHEGVCLWDDRKRVSLLMDICGRAAPITVRKAAVMEIG